MKVGDKKQAVILGVVAVGALLFLGNTILTSFGSASTPPQVDTAARAPENPPASAVGKLPETEPSEAGSEPMDSGQPDRIEKTPFAPPSTPAPKRATVSEKSSHTEQASGDGKLPKLPGDTGETVPVNPMDRSQDAGALDDARRGPIDDSNPSAEPEKPKPITVKFEGYVDAGNPVAIIRIGESQYTADQGEGLPHGIRVIAITAEKLTLSVRGRLKSVWIGREVQL